MVVACDDVHNKENMAKEDRSGRATERLRVLSSVTICSLDSERPQARAGKESEATKGEGEAPEGAAHNLVFCAALRRPRRVVATRGLATLSGWREVRASEPVCVAVRCRNEAILPLPPCRCLLPRAPKIPLRLHPRPPFSFSAPLVASSWPVQARSMRGSDKWRTCSGPHGMPPCATPPCVRNVWMTASVRVSL